MDELNELLNEIMNVYNEDLSNDLKHERLSKLWTEYYKSEKDLGIKNDLAYNLYLLGENESYIINQAPIRKDIDYKELDKALCHLKEVISDNELGLTNGITEDEAKLIMDYSIENTRKSFEVLGINLENASLNGLCELGQSISLIPLEKLGLKVTKNKASDTFDYNLNHRFGTVTFPIYENDEYKEKTYLVDPTYRQFFSSVRCNEGRYYTEEENTLEEAYPDPGYFVEDKEFARDLMGNGYIELNEENAFKYGDSFYKASISKEKVNVPSNIDYLNSIMINTSDYVNISDLDDFNLSFPDTNTFKK